MMNTEFIVTDQAYLSFFLLNKWKANGKT